LRANLTSKLSDKANVAISTGYVSSRLRLPQNDNDVLGIITNGYTGVGSGPIRRHPHLRLQLCATSDVPGARQAGRERFTGSITADWRPLPWLSGRATAGTDVTQRVEGDIQRFGEGPIFANLRQGFADDNRFRIFSWTANATGTASFQLTPTVSSKTSVGVQYFHDLLNGNNDVWPVPAPRWTDVGSASLRNAFDTTSETVTSAPTSRRWSA